MQDLASTPSSTISTASLRSTYYHGTTPATSLTQHSPVSTYHASAQSSELPPSTPYYSSPFEDRTLQHYAGNTERISLFRLSSLDTSSRNSVGNDAVKLSATATPFTPRISGRSLSFDVNTSVADQRVDPIGHSESFVQETAPNDPFLSYEKFGHNPSRSSSAILGSTGTSRAGSLVPNRSRHVRLAPTVDLKSASRYIQISGLSKSLTIREIAASLSVSLAIPLARSF